jgi:hypothetical protein
MNKRLQKLAEQSEMSANKGDHVDVKQMMEKFAELIVHDVFIMIKESCIEGDGSTIDEIIDDRLQDAAGDVVDAYGIVDRVY